MFLIGLCCIIRLYLVKSKLTIGLFLHKNVQVREKADVVLCEAWTWLLLRVVVVVVMMVVVEP